MPNCVNCDSKFTQNLDDHLCDDCVTEAYSHKPEKHVRIRLEGGSSFVVPIAELGMAMMNEIDGAEVGSEWTIELIEMSLAEYAKLPDFTGH